MDSEQMIHPPEEADIDTRTRAEGAFLSMLALRKTLQGSLDALKDKPLAELKIAGLATLHKDLGKAVQMILLEEGKVEDALRTQRGGDGIDLDAARAEIGRRLDGIRAHLDAGEISEATGSE